MTSSGSAQIDMASRKQCIRNTQEVDKGKHLVEAARRGDFSEIVALIKAGVSVNAEEYNRSLFYASENYVTPLQVAAGNGHEACVKYFIELGADLNARDRFDVTAVHMAAENGHYNCLNLLLDAGADCNVPTKYSKLGCYTATPHPGGTTPLHLAAIANRVNCVKELIQNGADYNAVDEKGRTSLYIAAESGLKECVLVHLRNAIGKDILSLPVSKTGNTPLHCCVMYRLKECVSELLDHGSDVNHRNYNGYSPLHYCVFQTMGKEKEALEILKELVIRGYNTDVNLPDKAGMSPLHFVSFSDGSNMERRPEAAEFLIAYGANTHICNKRGNNLIQAELVNGTDRTILKAIIKTLPKIPSLVSLNLVPPAPPRAFALLRNDQGRRWGRRSPPAFDLVMDQERRWGRRSPPEFDLMNGGGDGAVEDFHAQENSTPSRKKWAKYQWYKQLASSPRSLQHCCRYAIRSALGYKRLRYVDELPIPTSLKEYLLLKYDEFK